MKKTMYLAVALLATASSSVLAENNYSCNNLPALAKWEDFEVTRSDWRNGVTYKEIETVSGHKGVRLSGEGIGGGLCFDSVGLGKTAYAKRAWKALGSSSSLGDKVNSVSSNPTVGLYKIAVEDGMDNYGLVLSGGGIGGKLGFEDEELGLEFLAWYHDGQFKGNGRITGDKAKLNSFTNKKGQRVVKLGGQSVSGSITVKY